MKKPWKNIVPFVLWLASALLPLSGCNSLKQDTSRTATDSGEEEYSGSGDPTAITGVNLTAICESTTSAERAVLSCPLYNCSEKTPTSCTIVSDTNQVPNTTKWKWTAKNTGSLQSTIDCAVRSGGIEYSCSAPQGLGYEVSLSTNVASTKSSTFKSRPFAVSSISPAEIPSNTATKLTVVWSGTLPSLDDIVSVKIGDYECASPTVTLATSTVSCTVPAIMGGAAAQNLAVILRLGYGTAKGYAKLAAKGAATSATATPTPTATSASQFYIFLTTSTYSATFGGLSIADGTCQTLGSAGSVCPTCTWKAVLSDGTATAASRINVSKDIYKKVGTAPVRVMAANAFFSGSAIESPINMDQNGAASSVLSVWTASTATGGYSGTSCINWSSNSVINNTIEGTVNGAGSSWLSNTSVGCNGAAGLYCISQ